MVLALVGVAAYVGTRTRRAGSTRKLKERFGDEYDRVVERSADTDEAERELEGRVERRERMDIRELSHEERQRYVHAWRDVQRRFVDDPEGTLGEADRLITQAMRDRGYPTEHFDQKVEDLSVDHADTLQEYRKAHEIADRHERQGVSTDDLRRAMQHYRTIFEAIVETHAGASGAAASDSTSDSTTDSMATAQHASTNRAAENDVARNTSTRGSGQS